MKPAVFRITLGTVASLLAAVPASPGAAQDLTDASEASGTGAPADLIALPLTGQARIDLDGSVNEEVWSTAVPITDFTQQEPVEGGTPSERTEVRIVFDEDNLYIGAIVYDDPEGIMAYQRQRDAGLGTDDRFMWILDTFLDGRTGYFFEINAAGLMGDGIMTGGGGRFGGINKSWDGIWEARTAQRPDGWSAEIRIPFRTLNFNPELDTWGINFQRTIRRRNEEILWRGWLRNQGLFRPVYAGRVTGLNGMSQGIGLEARPSTVASWKNIPGASEETTYPRDISLDINYSVTSSLRASFSLNTDFAEVESDDRRVNLTRFPLRFPERRDFFLEGSGVFSFAPRSGPSPFFSRNIGISSGQQVPIDYGTRVTGQVGRFEVGFYQIGTGSHSYLDDGLPTAIQSEDFTVARAKRRIFEQSAIGAIYTRRSTAADPSGFAPDNRHTAGVDLALNSRSFLGDNNAEFEAFLVWNSNPDPTEDLGFGDLSAHGFRFNFPNDLWSGHISYRQFGDDYRPAVGFVTRNDFRRVEPRIGFSPRPESIDWIRRFNFSVQFRNLTELGTGVLEEREWDFNVFSVDFESGDNISFSAKRTYEFLDNGFEIRDGVDIEPGEYTTWEYSIRGRASQRRPISAGGGITKSQFWNGDRTNYNIRASFRPNPGISFSTNFQYNDVKLPQGAFTASVYELSGQWNPSPWVSYTNQVQYDDVSEIVGLFARLRWIVRPGNDVYLVYTHNWQSQLVDPLDPIDPLDRQRKDLVTISRGASIKAAYTYRF